MLTIVHRKNDIDIWVIDKIQNINNRHRNCVIITVSICFWRQDFQNLFKKTILRSQVRSIEVNNSE